MGAFHTRKDVDGSLARCDAPVGARGPVRVLPLAIFFPGNRRGIEKKKKKKKDPRDDGQKCLLQCFTNVIGFH